jgi:pyruvate formate lyase activating enzyme
MNIRGFVDTSFVDWDKKVSSVVFTGECNMRCTFCYNFGLVLHPNKFEVIPEKLILDYLEENSDFIDGLCITGGEPTVQRDLRAFCEKVKSFGLDVKLDTNGTNPQLLGQLLDQGLIDYVAMDVKAPLNPVRYSELAGVNLNGGMADIKKSIKLLMNSGVDYEFRTTVVPGVHTQEDIEGISQSIAGSQRYYLQKFKPNTRFDELNKSHTQSDEEMELLAQTARKHVKEVEWRGK